MYEKKLFIRPFYHTAENLILLVALVTFGFQELKYSDA